MAGNSIGQLFKVTTFGESHGLALGCVIDGCPPGLYINIDFIQHELDRRKPGTSHFVSQRKENDRVEIVSGVFEQHSTGTPIALIIYNHDQRSQDYTRIKEVFRPGHADYVYWLKYAGIRDYRGGGRASARETVARVAAGAIAKLWLKENFNTLIQAYVTQIGSLVIHFEDERHIAENPFFVANTSQLNEIENYLKQIQAERDSIGAKLRVCAHHVPAGLGEPVFDKLYAKLAYAMMGINAVKAVEIGDGVDVVKARGSEHSDEMNQQGFLSNHAGGILGGISTGQDIVLDLSFKPTASIAQPRRSLNIHGEEVMLMTKGRHDPCVGLRAAPIVEAMMALVLIDHALRYRGQCGDCHISRIF